jgi:hypothetical protein
MRRIALILSLLALTLPISAAPRDWKSADGTRSIQGEFLKRDVRHVTIRRTDGRVFTLEVAKLHPDDLQWLNQSHPIAAGKPAEPVPDETAVFDTLHFGDDRKTVEKKLKASKAVELSMDETFLGRFGLNGTFRTRQKIGGLHCLLYFDWSDGGLMREVSLQTEPLTASSYSGRIQDSWKELIELLTNLNGKPLQDAEFPKQTDLADGLFLASHLWRLEGGGSALLGTSCEGNQYMVVVRFTQDVIEPIRVP